MEQKLAGLISGQAKVLAVGKDLPAVRNYKPTKEPYPIFVLNRGDVQSPREEVQPGALAAVSTLPENFDLPNPKKSGLFEALHVLDGVDGIRFCHFEDVDVVRHHLVQRIVRAYDSYGRAQQELPLSMGEPGMTEPAAMSTEKSKPVAKPQ